MFKNRFTSKLHVRAMAANRRADRRLLSVIIRSSNYPFFFFQKHSPFMSEQGIDLCRGSCHPKFRVVKRAF
jgi:hypothetical protein